MYFREIPVISKVYFLNSDFIFDNRFDFLVLQNIYRQIFVHFDINQRSVDSYFDRNLQLSHIIVASLRNRQIGSQIYQKIVIFLSFFYTADLFESKGLCGTIMG